jgi:hypothetical protein
MNKTPTGGTMKFKKKEAGQYICEIDGYIIDVAKYYPGEMWWDNQNFYWAWTISTPNGEITPGGNYQRRMNDCKIDSLEMLEIVREG